MIEEEPANGGGAVSILVVLGALRKQTKQAIMNKLLHQLLTQLPALFELLS